MRTASASRRRPHSPGVSQFILLGSAAMRAVLGLILTLLLGRKLSAQEFGGFALVSTIFALAREFTELGTGNVAVRAAARDPREERLALESLLAMRLSLCTLCAALCLGYAVSRTEGMLRLWLVGSAVALLFMFFSALTVAFQLRQAQLMPAIVNVLGPFLTLGAAVLMLSLGVQQSWFPALVVARESLSLGVLTLLGIGLLGYVPMPRFSRASLRRFETSTVIVALATLFYNILFFGGIFIVQAWRPPDELGAFAAAQRPLATILIVPWLLISPLVPVFSYAAGKDPAAFSRQSRALIDVSLGLGTVVAAALTQTARPMIAVLYGGRYLEAPISAVDCLRWFALPVGLAFVIAPQAILLLADNQERRLMVVSLLGVLAYLTLNALLLPQFGFVGSAMASCFAVSLVALCALGLAFSRGLALGPRSLAMLAPGMAVYTALEAAPDSELAQIALSVIVSLLACLAIWNYPGLADSRAEQERLSRALLAAGD